MVDVSVTAVEFGLEKKQTDLLVKILREGRATPALQKLLADLITAETGLRFEIVGQHGGASKEQDFNGIRIAHDFRNFHDDGMSVGEALSATAEHHSISIETVKNHRKKWIAEKE